jgi:hypothetical protein
MMSKHVLISIMKLIITLSSHNTAFNMASEDETIPSHLQPHPELPITHDTSPLKIYTCPPPSKSSITKPSPDPQDMYSTA